MDGLKILFVGAAEFVEVFKGFGVETLEVSEASEAERKLRGRLAKKDVAVVFFPEKWLRDFSRLMKDFADSTVPAFVPIPDSEGAVGEGMERLRELVKKAVGVDILR